MDKDTLEKSNFHFSTRNYCLILNSTVKIVMNYVKCKHTTLNYWSKSFPNLSLVEMSIYQLIN